MARNLSALVIDPDLDSRLDVGHALQAISIDLAGEVPYGTEAAFVAADRQPEVVLLALGDPPVRGLATLEAIRLQLPDTPVITYSSSPTSALMREAMRGGAQDLLAAPVSAFELRRAIDIALSYAEQRQVARWSEPSTAHARGSVLTVAGAKGGTGKSTLAANLAVAIRSLTGQAVALVDSDAQFGDLAVLLDLVPERSIADLARSEGSIDRVSVLPYLTRHDSGVEVLAAAAAPDDWRAVRAEHIASIVHALAETHEWVLIDTAGTMDEVVAASIEVATVVLLMTSLDVSSVKDTTTALRILDSWGLPREHVRLVVNDSTHTTAIRPEDVATATGEQVAFQLPYDAHVLMAVDSGKPVLEVDPSCPYAKALASVAERLAGLERRRRVPRWVPRRFPLARGSA